MAEKQGIGIRDQELNWSRKNLQEGAERQSARKELAEKLLLVFEQQ
jgi:hypothetical protein